MGALRRTVIQCASLGLALSGCSDDGGENSGGDITFSVGLNPLMFAAAQVGDGPWEVITPSADGKYKFAADGETYGIAAVCGYDVSTSVTFLHATLAETRTPSIDCEVLGDPSATLSGTITGIAGAAVVAQYYEVGFGPTYMVTVPPGTWDLFALDQFSFGDVSRVVRKNAVTVTADMPTVVDFDFAANGFALESHSVSLDGLQPTETPSVASRLRNKPGGSSFALGSTKTNGYRAIPAAQLRDDDINVVTATASLSDGSYRQVRRMFVAAQDFTATLPPTGPSSEIESESESPYLRLRGVIASGFLPDRLDLAYRQRISNISRVWTVSLSKGYREETSIENYALPDLAGLPGFDVGWGLIAGSSVEWNVVATTSDAGAADLFEANRPASALDGRTHLITQRGGRFPN